MPDALHTWQPPEPPAEGEGLVSAIDPRVDTSHTPGVLPCPSNPPPPDGWKYWHGAVPAEAGKLAATMLHDPHEYPMGTFVQAIVDGRLIGARVEWHTYQGATGKTGCFRGVNLLQAVTRDATTDSD